MKNYPYIIHFTPSYLEHCIHSPDSNSAMFIFASLPNMDQLLKERTCSPLYTGPTSSPFKYKNVQYPIRRCFINMDFVVQSVIS